MSMSLSVSAPPPGSLLVLSFQYIKWFASCPCEAPWFVQQAVISSWAGSSSRNNLNVIIYSDKVFYLGGCIILSCFLQKQEFQLTNQSILIFFWWRFTYSEDRVIILLSVLLKWAPALHWNERAGSCRRAQCTKTQSYIKDISQLCWQNNCMANKIEEFAFTILSYGIIAVV